MWCVILDVCGCVFGVGLIVFEVGFVVLVLEVGELDVGFGLCFVVY